MAKQKFGVNLTKTTFAESAATDLKKLEGDARDIFNFQHVDYSLIDVNDMNDFEISDIETLKESIRKNGLLQPLILKPLDNGRYRIIAGERRYHAIGDLLKEDSSRFAAGIPAKIERMDLSEIDEEIKLREDNIIRRANTPEVLRKNMMRLKELYTAKNEREGTSVSITRQIADNLSLSERQVQRLNAINERLIPELQSMYDEKKITTENAAKFANMDEDTQKMVYGLLQIQSKVTPAEILALKEEQEKRLQAATAENEVLVQKLQDKTKETERLTEEFEKRQKDLQEEREQNQQQIAALQKRVNGSTDTSEVELLKEALKQAHQAEEKRQTIEETLKRELEMANKETEKLRKQIEDNAVSNVTDDTLGKIKAEAEISHLVDSLKKELFVYKQKVISYRKSYDESYIIPESLQRMLREIE